MSCLASAVICLWARAAALASRLRAFKRAKSAPARIWVDAGSSFGEGVGSELAEGEYDLLCLWGLHHRVVNAMESGTEPAGPVAAWVPPALDRDLLAQ